MKTKVPLKLAFLVFLLGFTIQTFSKSKNTNIMNSTKKETIGLLVIMKAKTGKEYLSFYYIVADSYSIK